MSNGRRTEIVAGDDRPVVRKTASTEAARVLLAAEAERLTRARHPGVVTILAAHEDHLDLDWAGDRTLATARPSFPEAAATLASVTTTVADLHALGIVHGRIEGAHVILGADGRPRLCSFRPPAAGEATPTPADDVADLGRLMTEVIGGDVDLEPIPERRWRREKWTGFQRRSLQTLADQAADPDPARRPTARSLAASIVESVPHARLGPARAGQRRPDEADPAEAVDDADDGRVHEPSDPAPAGTEDAAPDEATPIIEAEGSATEGSATEGSRVEPDALWWLPGDRPLEGWSPRWPSRSPAAATETSPDPGDTDVATSPAGRPSTFLGMRVDDGDDTVRSDASTGRWSRPRSGDDAQGPSEAPIAPRSLALGAVALLLLVALAAGRWSSSSPATDRVAPPRAATDDASAADEAGTAGAPAATDPATPSEAPDTPNDPKHPNEPDEPACPTTQPPSADVDGDGCEEPYLVAGPALTVAGVTYEVGRPEDLLTVADWDCDGIATPGLVRPATGEVFLFDSWAEPDRPLSRPPDAVVRGARGLVGPEPDRPCPAPRALLADGRTRPLPNGPGAS